MIYDIDFYDSIEFYAIYGNNGIGSYEFWGYNDYDYGHDYVEEIHWDRESYSDHENELIEKYVEDNFDLLSKHLMS